MNSGGIRDSLPAGTITYRDLLKVNPWGNTIGLVRLSGAELVDYLRAAAKFTPGAGGFPQTAGPPRLHIPNAPRLAPWIPRRNMQHFVTIEWRLSGPGRVVHT